MPNKWTTAIPEAPSPNYVIVKNIALQSTESTVKEFFLFCGKIKEFEMKVDEDDEKHQIALIHFERESAAKTAALLSNALIDDSHIVAAPYFDVPGSSEKEASSAAAAAGTNGTEEHENQESKPKTKILAEILANGYLLQDQVVAKGVEYDNKYHVSSRWNKLLNAVQTNVKHFDEKYRIWDKAVNLDQKYKITENVNKVTQTAQEKATQALQTGLQSTPGQKAKDLADKTLHQIAAVHYEAKRIQVSNGVATA
ncbi:hypothetical protein BDF20DRAFT_898705 [Mycotypha africana]|uniref:uncharacterized protein n=1 Tax=Mycotypha africana TaxID=64632 RepID=UPI0022FFF4C0|nr:uncharacterized protein BDF20DRAFT_898705 [Mycotypha africana]KAI8967684.1 hypothetical protein BDF20DRAFT_898705 [Mycotypha africana]